MAPFVPLANGIHTEVLLWDPSFVQGRENNFWFVKDDGPPDIFYMNTFNNAIHNWYNTAIMPYLSNQIVHFGTLSRLITTISGLTVSNFGFSTEGGQDSKSLPSNVALRATFLHTGMPGVKAGGIYIYGLPVSHVSDDYADVYTVSGLQAGLEELYTVAISMGATWVVTSAREGGAWRADRLAFPVTAASFGDRRVDSQRRRLPPPVV